MKIRIKGTLWDLLAFRNLLWKRAKKIRRASAEPITSDPVGELAQRLHPEKLHLIVDQIREETKSARTFRLVPDREQGTNELPFFRAGQYLSLKVDVDGVKITRPYSISSSPGDSQKGGFYEITIRKEEGGFLTEHIWKAWTKGTKVLSSAPAGFFYYERLRDSRDLVALAGGSGITPFRSMMKDILENDLDIHFTLLYGVRNPDDIIFEQELKEIERQSSQRIQVHFICSEPDEKWKGETGFLTSDCIRKYVGEAKEKTFFLCGPQLMYRFLEEEMKALNVPPKRIRREAFGKVSDIHKYPGFPKEAEGKTFQIKVHIWDETRVIPAKSTESLLVALERASLSPPSQCRSGECGYCRSLKMQGEIYVCAENERLRYADRKTGYFHLCCAYPLSDMEIKISRENI